MRTSVKLILLAMILVTGTACGSPSLAADSDGQVTRAQQVWAGDWHAEWQIEWAGAPVRGPLVIEVWHAADGRLRIETLEAPIPALSGLTLVDDGSTVWLHDLRQNQVQSGSDHQVKIPLASDALDAMDQLLSEPGSATVKVSGRDTLESGPAIRLSVTMANGDQATVWTHNETGLPARVEFHSAVWGEATFSARSISATRRQDPALFLFP